MPDSSRHGALPVLTAAMLWGTTGTASTFAPAGVPPAAIGSAGLVFGGFLLFLGGRRARPRAAFSRRERWLLALGALAVPGYPLTFYPAVARDGVAVATVLGIALLHERLPAVSWAGMATLAVGLAVLAVPRVRGVFRWQRRLPRGSSSAPSLGCAPPASTRK